MRRKASAIVQQKEGWYGVTFTVQQKKITDLTLIKDKSLRELKESIGTKAMGSAWRTGQPICSISPSRLRKDAR